MSLSNMSQTVPIVDPASGCPTAAMITWWSSSVAQLLKLVGNGNLQSVGALNDAHGIVYQDGAHSFTKLPTGVATTGSVPTVADTDARYVKSGVVAAPAYTPYAGQTVSATYVQAEAQATDNAVKALGAAVHNLIVALQSAGALT
jgi:hypothetical protein